MKIYIGKSGLNKTQQDPFPETVKCSCGGEARIAFVAHEEIVKDWLKPYEKEPKFVFEVHKNEGKGKLWPHDVCSFAVYLCSDCHEAKTLWNQG